MKTVAQVPLKVFFRGEEIGVFFADILIEDIIIIEQKAVNNLLPEHKAQLINSLKATGIGIGFLVNFGKPKVEYRRFDNKISPPSFSSL